MLSGDNGILQRATQSKEKTERAEIIENAQMDILAKISEKKGENLTASELEEILTSPNYNTQGRLSDEESILDRTLTSNNGKYQIPVSEIYNGTLTNTAPSIPTEYTTDVKTALVEGKYVTYNNKPFVVLYNNDDGIEIIAMETIGTVTLGANDETEGAQGTKGELSRAKWSYNNAIQTLNKFAENLFPSDSIIDDARCVGSMPGKTNGISNKNMRNTQKYIHGSKNIYFSSYDNQFEQAEEIEETSMNLNKTLVVDSPNYINDNNKMEQLGILNIKSYYWMASRYMNIQEPMENNGLVTNEGTYFNISFVQYVNWGSGEASTLENANIIKIMPNNVDLASRSIGFRPVLHVSHTAKVKNNGGDGTSEKPFVLE